MGSCEGSTALRRTGDGLHLTLTHGSFVAKAVARRALAPLMVFIILVATTTAPAVAGARTFARQPVSQVDALRPCTNPAAGRPVKPFLDVAIDHPFCAEIVWAKDYPIAGGYTDGTYRPDAFVTRMAIAAFVSRYSYANLPACSSAPFIDVPADHPFCPEIKWLKDSAVTTGYDDGTFRPTSFITRMAMAAFLVRLAGATPTRCASAPFTDVPADHPFCAEIGWMKDHGVASGYGDGSYRPAHHVTRMAVAAVLYEFSEIANLPPVVTTSEGATTFTEGGGAVVIDDALTVSDPDDLYLASASATITSGFQAGDVLVLSSPRYDITSAYDPATGVLTLNGVDSFIDYQVDMWSITFSTTNDNPVASKTIEFKVNDGHADSGAATKEITVT